MIRRSRAERRQAVPAGTRHLVLLVTDRADRRLADLHGLAADQVGSAVRVVVLADDLPAAREDARQWRRRNLTDVPVDVLDASSRTVADAIRAAVQGCLDHGWEHVTVVVPHVIVGWPWGILHNHTEKAVARSLRDVRHVDVIRVPVDPR